MSGVVPVLPRFKFFKNGNNPVSNGSVTVYLAGSTTPVNTYQDSDLQILNTNPVNLDANGECTFWLSDASTYRFLVTAGLNGTGATVSDTDNIPGSGLGSFIQSGTGAVRRPAQEKAREVVSVTDFMTAAQKADILLAAPLVDQTAAIQAALDYCAGSRALTVPPGRYRIASPLTAANHQLIVAENPVDGGSEFWFYGADGENCIQSAGLDTAEKSRCEIVGLRIMDKRTSPTSGWGIHLANVDNRTLLERLFVANFPTGQIYFGAPVGKAADCLQVRDVWLSSTVADAIGIQLERVENNVVIDTVFADITSGTVIDVSGSANDAAVISINNVKHEANNASYSASFRTINIGQTHGNVLISNVIQRNKTGTGCDVVQVTNSSGARIQLLNVTGDQHLTAGVAPYTLDVLAPFAQTFNGRLDRCMAGTGGRFYRDLAGNSTPEGAVTAYVGEMFRRLDGGANTALYFKGSGAGTNTGWVQLCGFLTANSVQDLPSIADGAQATFTVTVTGAAVGDMAMVAYGGSGGTLQYTAQVTGADTVTVIASNHTGAPVDASSQTFQVRVFK